MAQCKQCDRSGLLFWTNSQGLCRSCQDEMRTRVEEERERVKEALIWVRCNKSPEDKLIHLRRAMDGVRALQRYERLGCPSTRPSPSELAELLRNKLEEVRGEQKVSVKGKLAAGEPIAPPERRGEPREGSASGSSPAAKPWERRRSARRAAQFAVRVVSDGVRGRAEDVSVHGVRLRSPVVHRSGSRVRLRFQTPAGLVATEGVVRWAERSGADDPIREPGAMGLEWTEVPGSLRGYLESRPPSGRAPARR